MNLDANKAMKVALTWELFDSIKPFVLVILSLSPGYPLELFDF
jgi:hypothetical protein